MFVRSDFVISFTIMIIILGFTDKSRNSDKKVLQIKMILLSGNWEVTLKYTMEWYRTPLINKEASEPCAYFLIYSAYVDYINLAEWHPDMHT